jgi:diacylglycerol kinase
MIFIISTSFNQHKQQTKKVLGHVLLLLHVNLFFFCGGWMQELVLLLSACLLVVYFELLRLISTLGHWGSFENGSWGL